MNDEEYRISINYVNKHCSYDDKLKIIKYIDKLDANSRVVKIGIGIDSR